MSQKSLSGYFFDSPGRFDFVKHFVARHFRMTMRRRADTTM